MTGESQTGRHGKGENRKDPPPQRAGGAPEGNPSGLGLQRAATLERGIPRLGMDEFHAICSCSAE
jgi:hypothetical protein